MLFPRESSTRDVRELGGIWEFAKDKADAGIAKSWFQFPPATRPIAVSANYNEQTADDDLWEFFGAVWYFRRFIVPASWDGKRIVLRVGAANYRSEVWLDGRSLVKNEGGALPFEADVTRRVAPGKSHLVAVRIDSTLTRKTIPPALPWKQTGRPFEYQFDFLNMSGIHRPVRLYATPKTHLADITAVPFIRGTNGGFDIEYTVKGRYDAVRFTAIDHRRRAAATIETAKPRCRLSIPKCRFWSPESPYLYTLRIEVLLRGEVIDEYPLPVGVRTVKVSGGKFLLNGKPVYFKGASRHEDFPVIGRGVSEAVLVKDFSMMKWLNVNSYRTAHYPHSEEELDMADRVGIMIIDEAPAVGMNDWVHKIFVKGLVDKTTQKAHLEMIKRQFQRDKNHPCVVMWSIADEPASNEAAWVTYAKPLFAYLKKADSMRPVSFATTAYDFQEKSARLCDVILLNRYYGWYQRTGQLNNIEGPLSDELDRWHVKFKKPIIFEEFGAEAVEGYHHQPPLIFSEEYQLELAKRTAKVLDSKPYVIGEHIWVMFDFLTKQGLSRVGGNRKGICTRLRQPKMSAHWLRERWAGK